jgi:threonine/homoserine/homoserine lactone efflux protein
MEIPLFLRGLLIGFAIAAPVGPIGVLCIRQTLTQGWLAGLISGLGAATADALYGCIAGFGLSAISQFLINQQIVLRWVGGAFLCYLGIQTFLSQTAEKPAQVQGSTLAKMYGSTLFLTLTNPTTILSFVAVFAGLGIASTSHQYQAAIVLVSGVFSGSALWWLTLSTGTNFLRDRLTAQRLVWVNRISGLIIGAFGLVAISTGFL